MPGTTTKREVGITMEKVMDFCSESTAHFSISDQELMPAGRDGIIYGYSLSRSVPASEDEGPFLMAIRSEMSYAGIRRVVVSAQNIAVQYDRDGAAAREILGRIIMVAIGAGYRVTAEDKTL